MSKKTLRITGVWQKVPVQCSADTFAVNQSLVLRINICGKIDTVAKRPTVKKQKIQN